MGLEAIFEALSAYREGGESANAHAFLNLGEYPLLVLLARRTSLHEIFDIQALAMRRLVCR